MNQFKRQLRRKRGLPYKRDTPIKPATRRRDTCRRHLAIKHYDSIPEEPEEEKTYESTAKPVSLVRVDASVPCLSSSGFTENTRSQPASPVTSTITEPGQQKLSDVYPTVQAALIPEVFKGDGTPESGTSCIMELDSTNSEDEDDDDYIYSSASTTLSSFPSPEIFRKEKSADTTTFPNKDDLLCLQIHVKNSTLLEDSHAENIHMHQPPNLSNIIDASTILVENKCEISCHKTPKDETERDTSLCKSDQTVEKKISPKDSERKLIFYKKKVWFKSPITTEIPKAKDITSCTPSSKNTSISSGPSQEIKAHPTTSRTSMISSNDETLPFAVTLKRPVKTCSENTMFFHFENDSEGEAFFQKMRERCVIIRSAVFLPFKLGSQNPQS